MICPKCGYAQYCPCPSCRDRLPEDIKPWAWINGGELIECAHCGHRGDPDYWQNKVDRIKNGNNYRKEKNERNIY